MAQAGLFDSPFFVTIVCLVLVFALLSLLVSTLTELINGYFEERGRVLYQTLGRLFEDGVNPNFGQLLYAHPMIERLKKDRNSLPQYISAGMFAKGIIDLVGNAAPPAGFFGPEGSHGPVSESPAVPETKGSFDRFVNGVWRMADTPTKWLLTGMIDRSREPGTQQPLAQLEKELTDWYNDQMDRVSGWYKSMNRWRLFWVALAVAIGLNVDSIGLFQTLYRSPELRDRLLPVAEQLAARYDSLRRDTTRAGQERLVQQQGQWRETMREIDQIESLGLPVGWRWDAPPLCWTRQDITQSRYPALPAGYFTGRQRRSFGNILSYFLGILITAFSLSAGAPFWFDVLVKLVNIRRTGTKPSTDKKE